MGPGHFPQKWSPVLREKMPCLFKLCLIAFDVGTRLGEYMAGGDDDVMKVVADEALDSLPHGAPTGLGLGSLQAGRSPTSIGARLETEGFQRREPGLLIALRVSYLWKIYSMSCIMLAHATDFFTQLID